MSNATIRVVADETNADGELWALDLDRVSVSFPAEEGPDPTCQVCGEPIEGDTTDQPTWLHVDRDQDDDHQAEPDTGPGSWCNSAAIRVDEEENSVTVTISVGDPRGAFAFTVRRVAPMEGADGTVINPDLAGRLILHTPYPGEGMPHRTLTEHHPGTYLIG